MTTKIILHGGFAGHINIQNDSFFKEILKDTSDNHKVLLIYFAKDIDKIPIIKAEDIAQFKRNEGRKKVSFEVAKENIFTEQVKTAHIIYIHGGNTFKLLETMKKFPNLKKLFEDKTVAGESAGAYVLSTAFYSKNAGGMFRGLGLVPVQTICHYTGENEDKLAENKKIKTLLLPDYKYQVFVT